VLIIKFEYKQYFCGGNMAIPYLKNRKRFTSSLRNELVPLFDELSKKTRIPKSKLLDEAIDDLLKKYGSKNSTK
jgi:metal-responsive CopG/Arc/MetJ family transcriptional regulator